jgi:hypothetical protein
MVSIVPPSPLGPGAIRPSQGRVVATEVSPGRYYFEDPDVVTEIVSATGESEIITGASLRQEEGIARLRYDFEAKSLVDSFGNAVSQSVLRFPEEGRSVLYRNRERVYTKLDVLPQRYHVADDEELVERITYLRPDGTIVTQDLSYGRGRPFRHYTTGKKWWQAGASALGIEEGTEESRRLTTRDIERAILRTDYILIRNIPRG